MKAYTTIWLLCTFCCTAAQAVFGQESSVSLTVYNNDLALVQDVRRVRVEKGRSEIRYTDVAARLDPTSVYFTPASDPDKVTLLEQNYEYDLVNAGKILQKYIDRKVTLQLADGAHTGTLQSASGGDIVLRDDSGGIKIIRREAVKDMSFPALPAGLFTRPTLIWQIDSQTRGELQAEVGYLTHGIQWHAEYIAVAEKGDTRAKLSAWVSIDNKSGAAYNSAKLKLVAGDVHMAETTLPVQYLGKRSTLAEATSAGFQQKSFFEYHIYTLQRRSTVTNNQVKQLSLFQPADVPLKKRYVFDGQRHPKKVRVDLEFRNDKASGLGMPLPAGKIRVYKLDSDRSLVFIGEDLMKHTPKEELARIQVGDAFDIVGERTQMERRAIGKQGWEERWQIKLRNHKDDAVEVVVVEHLGKDWKILRKSQDFRKRDAHTIEFVAGIAANAETAIEYVVRYSR